MKKHNKRSLRSRAKSALRGGAAASGAVSLATLGLTTCQSDGGGVVDPPPPPPLTCKDVDHGQNFYASANVDSLALYVVLSGVSHTQESLDTVLVTDVLGATLNTSAVVSRNVQLSLTLDSLAVKEVKITLKGRWTLESGPCNFQRTFTCAIQPNGTVQVTQREQRLPFDVPRDVHIELVDRDGLRVNLRAAVAGEGTPEWRATAGTLERNGRLSVIWELPPDPGLYQIELSVDRGIHGIGFDALALEVS